MYRLGKIHAFVNVNALCNVVTKIVNLELFHIADKH